MMKDPWEMRIQMFSIWFFAYVSQCLEMLGSLFRDLAETTKTNRIEEQKTRSSLLAKSNMLVIDATVHIGTRLNFLTTIVSITCFKSFKKSFVFTRKVQICDFECFHQKSHFVQKLDFCPSVEWRDTKKTSKLWIIWWSHSYHAVNVCVLNLPLIQVCTIMRNQFDGLMLCIWWRNSAIH